MRLRQKLVFLLISLGGWGLAGWLLSRPKPSPQVRQVEKVVTQDRIVTQTLQTRITKPDGTIIEKVKDTQSKTLEKAQEKVFERTPLSQYSLGLSTRSSVIWPLKNDFTLELGKRLWDSPLWVTTSVNTDKTVTIGIRIEF